MKFGTKKEVEEAKKNQPEAPKEEEVVQDWVVDPAKEKAKKKEAKKQKAQAKKDGNKKEDSKTSTIVLGGVLLLLVVLGGGFLFIKGRQPKVVEEGPKVVEQQIDPSEAVDSAVSTMYNNGALVGIQVDPDENLSIMYYFDANGRAYAESPYINGLFIDKDKSLTEKQDGNGEYFFSIVDDMTPLYMIETMNNLVKNGKGKITDVTIEEEKAVNCRSYQIDIEGENVASVFDVVSENYCLEQIKMLYDLTSKSQLTLSNKLRLFMTIGDGDGQVAAAIFVIKDDTPYILYKFEGYTSIGGWKLDETIWNKDMNVNAYKELRSDYQSVQTFCGAQIEKWLDAHPEVLNTLGNRLNNNSSSSGSSDESSSSSESSSETEAKTE